MATPSTSRLSLLALVLATASGCAVPQRLRERSEEDKAEVARLEAEPVVAQAFAVEYAHDAAETTSARRQAYRGVEFVYTPSGDLPAAVAAGGPQRVFVLCHGWLNDDVGARDFGGQLIRGVIDRAVAEAAAPASLAFVSVQWDSQRVVFHESAIAAETIGRERVAPLLDALHAALPAARITLVGHSLGGRMVLGALDRVGEGAVQAAVLLEAAAAADGLLAEGNVGAFPGARGKVHALLNVCSRQDSVLELAYGTAMQSSAAGLVGLLRSASEPYAVVHHADAQTPVSAQETASVLSGGGILNVDLTGAVTGHSEVYVTPVFDLIWRAQ